MLPEHKTPAELDDLDRSIIEAQQKDPFFSFIELAEKWGITSPTIRNRIKKLKTNGVVDVVTVINPYKVGYETFAMIGIKVKSDSNFDDLVKSLQMIHGVCDLVMVAGSYDFFVTYVCHNLEEYRCFVTEELPHIAEIDSYKSFIGLDLYDRKYMIGVIG